MYTNYRRQNAILELVIELSINIYINQMLAKQIEMLRLKERKEIKFEDCRSNSIYI